MIYKHTHTHTLSSSGMYHNVLVNSFSRGKYWFVAFDLFHILTIFDFNLSTWFHWMQSWKDIGSHESTSLALTHHWTCCELYFIHIIEYYTKIRQCVLKLLQLPWREFHNMLLNEIRKMQRSVYNAQSYFYKPWTGFKQS